MKVYYVFLHSLNSDIADFYGLRIVRPNRFFENLLQMCRFGVLISEHGLVIPATSVFEVPETEALLRETVPLQRSGLLHLYSPTAELQAYAEKKVREYQNQKDLFGHYDRARIQEVIQIVGAVPWLPRITRSASKDIGRAWSGSARDERGTLRDIIRAAKVGRRSLTSTEEDQIILVPERLDGRAFILRNVLELIPMTLHPRDRSRVALLNNGAYVFSYTEEYCGTILRNTDLGDLSCGIAGCWPNGTPASISLRTYRNLLRRLGIDSVIANFASWEEIIQLKQHLGFERLNDYMISDSFGETAIVEQAITAIAFRPKVSATWHNRRTHAQVLYDSVWRAHDVLVPWIERECGLPEQGVTSPARTARTPPNLIFSQRKRTNPRQTAFNLEESQTMGKSKRVFLVHGRDEIAAQWMRNFLRQLKLDPLEWSEAVTLTGKAAPYVLDVVTTGLGASQATVVLFTPDEEVQLRSAIAGSASREAGVQSRPNVWFEAGIALAVMPDRTILVSIGPNRPASDLQGIHFIHLSDTDPSQSIALAQQLQTIGCDAAMTGSDFVKIKPTFTAI